MSFTNTRKIRYQTVEIDTTNASTFDAAAKEGKLNFETDKLYDKVVGVAVQIISIAGTPDTTLLKVKKFEIQGREVYPDGFFLKYLDTSSDVPLNKKFDLEIDEEAKASKVDIVISDSAYVAANDYKLVVVLKLENK